MHGLINRSIQCFLRDTYGEETWLEVARAAELGFENFEAMMLYDDVLTVRIVNAASGRLSKSRNEFLEDLGTYIVSHNNLETVRRLLRFGGETFAEFLHSPDELPGRSLLAVPELALPALDLQEYSAGNFTLKCSFGFPGHGHVLVGILRAMADDYGALVVLEHMGSSSGVETLFIQLSETQFSNGRSFDLSVGAK